MGGAVHLEGLSGAAHREIHHGVVLVWWSISTVSALQPQLWGRGKQFLVKIKGQICSEQVNVHD